MEMDSIPDENDLNSQYDGANTEQETTDAHYML